MKIKFLFLIISVFFICSDVYSQTVLKGKKLTIQLQKIDSLINIKQYETAMLLLDNKEKIILEENVSKKQKISFDNIKNILGSKKNQFEETNIIVEKLKNEYLQKHYCKSIELLDIDLNNENSFLETQRIKNELLPDLKFAKEKCEDYLVKVQQWNMQFENNEFEPLYSLLSLIDSEKNYFYKIDLISLNHLLDSLKVYKTKTDLYSDSIKIWQKSYDDKNYESLYHLLKINDSNKKFFLKNDLIIFNELIRKLNENYIFYKELSEFIENNTIKVIEKIDYNTIDATQAKQYIDILNANTIEVEKKIKEAPGINPNLENNYKTKLGNVENTIEILQKIIDQKKSTIKTNNKSNFTNNNNSNVEVLDFNYFAQVFFYLEEESSYREQGMTISSEKSGKLAITTLNKLINPNKKYLVKFEYGSYFYLDIKSSGGELSIYNTKDGSWDYSKQLTFKFDRFYAKSKNHNYETSDIVLEKLEKVPHDNMSAYNEIPYNFSLIVQPVPTGLGFSGGSKYFQTFSIQEHSEITIEIKILDYY